MDYLDRYRERVQVFGKDPKEVHEFFGRKSTKKFIAQSPNKTRIEIQGRGYDVVFQIGGGGDGAITNKILIAEIDTPISEGDILEWDNNYWLVLKKEITSRKTYIRCIVRQCEFNLRWVEQGTGAVKEIPAAMYRSSGNLTSNTEKYHSGIYYSVPIGTFIAILPHNDTTKELKKDMRFVLHDAVWKIYHRNTVASAGLLTLAFESANSNAHDDIENSISYIDEMPDYIEECDGDIVYSLIGSGTILLGETINLEYFKKDTYDNDVEIGTLSITLNNSNIVASLEEPNLIEITANTQGSTELVIEEDGVIVLEKTIRVVGLI